MVEGHSSQTRAHPTSQGVAVPRFSHLRIRRRLSQVSGKNRLLNRLRRPGIKEDPQKLDQAVCPPSMTRTPEGNLNDYEKLRIKYQKVSLGPSASQV